MAKVIHSQTGKDLPGENLSEALSLARYKNSTIGDKPRLGRRDVIDLTTLHIPTPVKRKAWIKLRGGLVLCEEDRLMISKGEWLTDLHTHAAQTLLKEQFPEIGGLQYPLL